MKADADAAKETAAGVWDSARESVQGAAHYVADTATGAAEGAKVGITREPFTEPSRESLIRSCCF